MSDRETFGFATDLEVRRVNDGRTIAGIAVPFDTPTERGGHLESFARGAFTRTIAERGQRVKLLACHNAEQLPVGRATLLREDPAGLYAEFAVSKTQAGDELLELVRDGAIDSLSVGVKPIADRWSADRRHRTHTECALYEVSAVNFPAFDDARILAVHSAGGLSVAEARERLARHTPPGTVPVAAALDRLSALTDPDRPPSPPNDHWAYSPWSSFSPF